MLTTVGRLAAGQGKQGGRPRSAGFHAADTALHVVLDLPEPWIEFAAGSRPDKAPVRLVCRNLQPARTGFCPTELSTQGFSFPAFRQQAARKIVAGSERNLGLASFEAAWSSNAKADGSR